MREDGFTIAAAVNDTEILRRNLLLSPGLLNQGENQLLIKRDFPSAGLAYNSALDEAAHDIVIFVHQDVYLPGPWFSDLRRSLTHLARARTNWGVLGSFGCRTKATEGFGRVYTNGIGSHGKVLQEPEPIDTLDEIVLVIRKSSGLRFDRLLPHFHLYGTDICMTARERGMKNFAFQSFCIHNTKQILTLPREFYNACLYVRRKWKRYLPIQTSCVKLSSWNGPILRRRAQEFVERSVLKRVPKQRLEDPRAALRVRKTINGGI